MDSIICPKCGKIVCNNPYFKGYYCGQCGNYEASYPNDTLTYLQSELKRTKEMLQVANERLKDAVPVVRCKDCVVHDNCITEDNFKVCGITDGYCRIGTKHGYNYDGD